MQEIANNIFVETGFRGCNVGFIVTEEGVVMIDTPQLPVDAIKWRDEIAKHGEVRYLINTEPHGDHFSGNHFFEGAIVAHEGTKDMFTSTSIEDIVATERIDEVIKIIRFDDDPKSYVAFADGSIDACTTILPVPFVLKDKSEFEVFVVLKSALNFNPLSIEVNV